jgi:hypothetical protein
LSSIRSGNPLAEIAFFSCGYFSETVTHNNNSSTPKLFYSSLEVSSDKFIVGYLPEIMQGRAHIMLALGKNELYSSVMRLFPAE